jgi:hypothetical protein
MLERVVALLEQQENLKRLSLEIRYIDSVFISPTQIIAVAKEFENENELIQNWNRAARQLAFRIQNNIPSEFDELRWDMYLILCANQSNLNSQTIKQIENNRYYFRKIVLCENDIDILPERIPLTLQNNFNSKEMTLLFENDAFFQKLKDVLNEEVEEEAIPDTIFKRGFSTAEELIKLLDDVISDGGKL